MDNQWRRLAEERRPRRRLKEDGSGGNGVTSGRGEVTSLMEVTGGAPLSLLSLLGAGSQGVVVAGGTHAAENLKLVARRLQGECFRSSCLFHRCMKAFPHPLTDSTSKEKPDKRGQKGNVQKTKAAPRHSSQH